MAKVTLQSIADQVGVSRMTVSNAFSRPDQLSAELRARILAAAAELGYVGPDPAARALARGRTGAVGLLLNGPLSEAFADEVAAAFVASVSDELTARGLALTVLTPPRDESFFPARDVGMDAAIVYTCEPDSAGVDWLERRAIPMVAVDQDLGEAVPRVLVDDRVGARAAAEHLATLGHTRVAVFTLARPGTPVRTDEPDVLSTSHPARERMAGWREGLGEREPVVGYVALGTEGDPYAAALELLRTADVTAVLCFSDVFAYAVVRAAEELGRSVPGDLSVIGFDDNPLAATVRPALTTVRQDVRAKGRIAVERLTDVLAGRPAEPVVLPTELVVRESTGPAPA